MLSATSARQPRRQPLVSGSSSQRGALWSSSGALGLRLWCWAARSSSSTGTSSLPVSAAAVTTTTATTSMAASAAATLTHPPPTPPPAPPPPFARAPPQPDQPPPPRSPTRPPFPDPYAQLSDWDEPSPDLREMCQLQLELLSQLLVNAGEAYREIRVYACAPSSLGMPSVQMRKVAAIGYAGGAQHGGPTASSGLMRFDGPEDMVVLSMDWPCPQVAAAMAQQHAASAPHTPHTSPCIPSGPGSSGNTAAGSSGSGVAGFGVGAGMGGGGGGLRGGAGGAALAMGSLDGWLPQGAAVAPATPATAATAGYGSAPGASAAAAGVGGDDGWGQQGGTCWELLLQQEVLVLPNSGTRVLPLVDQGLLVGLLVVDAKCSTAVPASSDAGSGGDGSEAGFPSLDSGAHSTPTPAPSTPLLQGAGLSALKLSAQSLAKTCSLHLKMAIQSMQLTAQADTARGLLRDIQRRASALNTFSAMLLPRMGPGQPDQDMAQGMALQGKRLQELLRQLDSALSRPPPPSTPLTAPSTPSTSSSSWAGGLPLPTRGSRAQTPSPWISSPPSPSPPSSLPGSSRGGLSSLPPRAGAVQQAAGAAAVQAGARAGASQAGAGAGAGARGDSAVAPSVVASAAAASATAAASAPARQAAGAETGAATTTAVVPASTAAAAAGTAAVAAAGSFPSTPTHFDTPAASVSPAPSSAAASPARTARQQERNTRLRNRTAQLRQDTQAPSPALATPTPTVVTPAIAPSSPRTAAVPRSKRHQQQQLPPMFEIIDVERTDSDTPSASLPASSGANSSSSGSGSGRGATGGTRGGGSGRAGGREGGVASPSVALVPIPAPPPAAIARLAKPLAPPDTLAASGSNSSSNSNGTFLNTTTTAAAAAARRGTRARQPSPPSTSDPPASSPRPAPAATPPSKARAGGAAHCSVADALAGLLEAVVRLASVNGVRVIIQSPLGVDAHAAAAASAAAASAASASAAAAVGPSAARAARAFSGPGEREAVGRAGAAGGGGAGGEDGSVSAPPVVLVQRPVRPVEAAVPAMALRRVMSYLLDIVLQCTPQGGQVCVSAQPHAPVGGAPADPPGRHPTSSGGRSASPSKQGAAGETKRGGAPSSSPPGGAWVQLLVIHTGTLALDRLHLPSWQLASAAQAAAPPPSLLQRPRHPSAGPDPAPNNPITAAAHQQQPQHRHPHYADAASGRQGDATLAAQGVGPSLSPSGAHPADSRRRRHSTGSLGTSSPFAASPRSSPSVPGSGLLSFSIAEQLVQAVGGSVSVSHPVPMVNATSGGVEAATCIEILLPGWEHQAG